MQVGLDSTVAQALSIQAHGVFPPSALKQPLAGFQGCRLVTQEQHLWGEQREHKGVGEGVSTCALGWHLPLAEFQREWVAAMGRKGAVVLKGI